MSYTGPQDYPDYTRLGQAAASAYLAFAPISFPDAGSKVAFQGYVGNTSSIELFANNATGARLYQIVVTFYNDALTSQFTGRWSGYFGNPYALLTTIPVLGNFCIVLVDPLGASGVPSSVDITMIGIAGNPRSTQLAGIDTMAVYSDPAVGGGGGTITHDLLTTIPGAWRFFLASGGAGVAYNIQQSFADGIWSIIAQGSSAANQVEDFVNLAPAPCRFTIQNTNAAAETLLSSLISVG